MKAKELEDLFWRRVANYVAACGGDVVKRADKAVDAYRQLESLLADLSTEEEVEEAAAHSSVAGEVAAFDRVVTHLSKRAGELFVRGKDEEAADCRNLTREVDEWRLEAHERLHQHINRNLAKGKTS